jgi:tetratricopeptide (TPR) repeat protein
MEGNRSAQVVTGSYRSMLQEFDGQHSPFALFQAGEAARRMGDHTKAERCFQRSLNQARCEGDKTSMARGFWGLATLKRLSGRIDAAVETYLSAAACAVEAGSAECLAWARAGHAEIIRHRGQHKDAITHHVELLDSFRDNGDFVGELWALQGIGQIHLVNHSTKAAEQFFRRAEDCAHRLGDLRALAFSQRALAISARRRGDLALARSFLAESGAIFEHLEYAVGIGFSLQELAHCEIVEGNFEEARKLVGEALTRFGDRFPLGRAWTLTTQAQIEKETGGPSQRTLAQSARIFAALGVVDVNLSRPQVRYSRRYFPVCSPLEFGQQHQQKLPTQPRTLARTRMP